MAKDRDDEDDKKETKKTVTKEVPETRTVVEPTMAIATHPVVDPADLLTEQEKLGPDPVSAPVEPEKAVVLDIPKNQPYPTGNPPKPEGEAA